MVIKMQPTYVMAFRKRLYNRGYRNIMICRYKINGEIYWSVSAEEPLSQKRVERICSVDFLVNSFR